MILGFVLASQLVFGMSEVVFRSPEGELEIQEIQGVESFCEVVETLKAGFGSNEEPLIDFKNAAISREVMTRDQGSPTRNYYAPIKQSEKDDISYIVTTLGQSSLAKIAKQKSTLKKLGKKVDNVHPYNFLYVIFSDEKNRSSLHALRDRSWVWDGFYDGIKGSLSEEAAKKNLKSEFLYEFAAKLSVDADQLLPIINDQDWSLFIKTLMKLLPRTGDTGRYDM